MQERNQVFRELFFRAEGVLEEYERNKQFSEFFICFSFYYILLRSYFFNGRHCTNSV